MKMFLNRKVTNGLEFRTPAGSVIVTAEAMPKGSPLEDEFLVVFMEPEMSVQGSFDTYELRVVGYGNECTGYSFICALPRYKYLFYRIKT